MDVDSCHLDGNADAVEFCPHHPFRNILAAATYTLSEEEGSRSGSISLFSADVDLGLELLHRVDTVGVFDVKWSHPHGSEEEGSHVPPLLAQADADGCLGLYSLRSIEGKTAQGAALREECREKVGDAMCLCVDWNLSSSSISLGLSDGSISVVNVRESQLHISESWEAHDYEVWATAFDACQPQLLYTGSDDCRFIGWDLRERPSTSVFQNTKSHQMGVCCISQNCTNSSVLLTGSYDEYLRVWDLRSTSKPISRYSICLGGGVWRVKHHPSISDVVLAACMHNGFAVVRVGDETAEVIESYGKHESLAYGADWKREECIENGTKTGSLVATCSFYDRLLRIWQPETLMVN